MNCEKAGRLISEYVDDTLCASLRRELENHIAECSVCMSILESTKRLIGRLSSLSNSEAQVDCWAGVRERIVWGQVGVPWWRRSLLKPVFAAPAFAIAALLAFLFFWSGQTPEKPTQVVFGGSEYASYISAHSRYQRVQAFNDPDVPIITAELEKASLTRE